MYVELHKHCEWSLLDGVGTALQGAQRAAELGHSALAMTEHAVLSGAVPHMDACHEVGIMPIVGVEAYYRPRRITKASVDAMRKRNESVEEFWEYFHMVLLAKDIRGWKTLMRLTSSAYRDGFYRYPCIDDELLDAGAEGLIISTSCISGFVPRAIKNGDERAAREHMDKLDRWVGEDWYFELQPHDFDDLRVVNLELPGLAVERSRPLVAASDAHFIEPTWHETQRVSVMIRTRDSFASQAKKRVEKGDDWYDLTAPETAYIGSAQSAPNFARNHPRLPGYVVDDAIRNTAEIANRCVPFVLDRSPKVPRFLSDPEASYRKLRDLVLDGLAVRGHRHDVVYERQCEHELAILRAKDFCDFFLITWDFMRWARSTDPLPELPGGSTPENDPFYRYTAKGGGRDRPMLVSVRGSGCASTVSYALGITTINPITWGLRFERFLNPDRIGLPDFDIDFSSEDADLIKERIKRKWGPEKVYDMIAHGTLKAKAAIGRVSGVFDIHPSEYAPITKRLSEEQNDEDLSELRRQVKELDRYFDEHPEVFEHASRLQRQVGTLSEHAAGVVLADRSLEKLMPLMKKSVDDDHMVTAFGETAQTEIVSSLGFLKLDLLVVTELAKLAYAISLIEQHYDKTFDLDSLPALEDPFDVDQATMELMRRGLMMGVFQYGGSASISSLVKRMAPEHMLHLRAINAVHRTPTMSRGVHNELVERRHDPSKITYWDPSVVGVLEESFGLMIYQEQVMDIFVLLGGFSPTRADSVRKIMSKYYRAAGDLAEQKLGSHREDFMTSASGLVSGGTPAAERVWEFCGGFCEYAFNKPHASQYSLLGYADSFVKTHYPDCFYTALLTFPPSLIKKPEQRRPFYERTVREARLLEVEVLPPDVNDSGESFTITREGVRFGLRAIKGMGSVSVADLVAGRPFATLTDLRSYTQRKGAKCNAGGLHALALAGALDRWGVRDDLTEEERIAAEEDRIGLALSVPDRIGPMREALAPYLHSQAEVDTAQHGDVVVVGGEVIGGREIVTRYGNMMARLTIAFGADEYQVSVRPRQWEHAQEKSDDGRQVLLPSVKDLVETDEPLIVRGTKDGAYDCVSSDRIELATSVIGVPA